MKKPYYRQRLKCWYFKADDGKEIRLDPDEKTAYELWGQYRHMVKFAGEGATAEGLLDEFLAFIQSQVSKTRFEALQYYASLLLKIIKGCLHATLSRLWWQLAQRSQVRS